MIDVTARLLCGSVYLSGEVVECSITFSHPPSPTHKISQSNQDVLESLAWASAQINCQCTCDPKVSKQQAAQNNVTHSDTSLGSSAQESGKIEVATKPRILFCDLRLPPGQARTCE